MGNGKKTDAAWIGVLVAAILGWNGCAFVSDTAWVYEDADYITVYDQSGRERILESQAGNRLRPNKKKNVTLGAVLITGAVIAGLWAMSKFE